MDELESLISKVGEQMTAGAAARQRGEEVVAEQHFGKAFELAMKAANALQPASNPTRVDILRRATGLALECGEVAKAERIVDEINSMELSMEARQEWRLFRNKTDWPDAWLIAAVRRDPPNERALDILAERHWKALFGRCQLLTLNHHKANDLGQEAWRRVLRARQTLKPGGNLPAYLATVATNLWRDRNRSARRAGPLAEERLLTLDGGPLDEEGQTVLSEVLPDLNALETHEQAILAMDIDKALERLSPRLRDVLVARYLIGESCAEIGERYGRTEQTISSWVRAATREMKLYFEERDRAEEGEVTP